MEVLLSKEHYCYQIHKLHTNEKQCLPPFYNRQPAHFYKKILTLPPINRGLHTINIIYIYTDSQEFFAQTVKLLSKKQFG